MQEFLTRRQSDSILMDSQYHQQMVLRDFLGAILQNQRWVAISSFSALWSLLLTAFQAWSSWIKCHFRNSQGKNKADPKQGADKNSLS